MKNPQVCRLTTSYGNCSQEIFRHILYDESSCSNFLKFNVHDICSVSQKSESCDQSVQYKSLYIHELNEIFNIIDQSKILLCCINRQNHTIKQLNANEFKSIINYEKIKLIDYLKHLITNRIFIEYKLIDLRKFGSYFLQEIIHHIRELDDASHSCVESPINEVEIGEHFQLSSRAVTCILTDCGFDLTNLDQIVSRKLEELNKKLKSMKSGSTNRISVSRFERQCEKFLQTVETDISPCMTAVGKVLEQLLVGHSSHKIDDPAPKSTSQYCSDEIDELQLHSIIGLKYSLVDIERKVTESVLELQQMQQHPQYKNHIFKGFDPIPVSPIARSNSRHSSSASSSSSFASSTPGVRNRHHWPIYKQYSVLSESIASIDLDINQHSVSSFDSGYRLTPANESSLTDSLENFDVIPFSDDEYEKITDDDIICDAGEDSDLCESFYTNSEQEIDSISFPVNKTGSINIINIEMGSTNDIPCNYKEFCNRNNFCQINRMNDFLFSMENLTENDEQKRFRGSVSNKSDKNIDLSSFPELDSSLFGGLNLSDKEKEDIEQKINFLVSEEESKSQFSSALQTTISVSLSNSTNDPGILLEILESILKKYQSHVNKEVDQFEPSSPVDIQDNNSAYSSCTCHVSDASRNSEQNTNNNADSKDEDSNELNITPDYPINARDTLRLDAELKVAFRNILSDSTCNDQIIDFSEMNTDQLIDTKCSLYQDTNININDTTFSNRSNTDWRDTISVYSEFSSKSCSKTNELGFIEDLELVLRLSELHLKSEFQSNRYNRSILLYDQQRIVDNYKTLTSHIDCHLFTENIHGNKDKFSLRFTDSVNSDLSKCQVVIQSNSSEVEKSHFEDNQHHQNRLCDTFDDIKEEIKTEFGNHVLAEFSLAVSQESKINVGSTISVSKSKKLDSFDTSSRCFERISVIIKLTKKLLNISTYQLNFISSIFNLKSLNIKSSLIRNKFLSVSYLRPRLTFLVKILSNLKYAIQNTYDLDKYNESFSEIDKLIYQSENLIRFSFDIENWMKKNGCEIDKIDSNNFDCELPDELLIKMDSNDVDSILSTSTQRLQITVTALSQYPCYNYFLKSSLPKAERLLRNCFSSNNNFGNSLNHSDLLHKLCKLRRITAICALNIVDLHVLLTKLESDGCAERNDAEDEVKNLLIFWRAVDGECHRLLRSTSLVHHIMVDTRKSYSELISLITVMESITRTVGLSHSEIKSMGDSIDTLMNFKQKILEWLEEVQLCISVIYKKRMTNKRFKFYDDIHNYLEENLRTIAELSDNMKIRCHQTVNFVNDVMTYCTNLSNCSITEIGNLLTSRKHINNDCLLNKDFREENINENLIVAIMDLEEITNRIGSSIKNEKPGRYSDSFQRLLCQSNAIFRQISEENLKVRKPEESNKNKMQSGKVPLMRNKLQISQEDFIVENTTKKIVEKIYKIVACAATNALLLFVDRYDNDLLSDNNDTDHQMSNWTNNSENETILSEISCELINDMSSSMATTIIGNIVEHGKDKSKIASEIIWKDLCCELGSQTLKFLSKQISLNQETIDESFLLETSSNIANYLCEELGCLMVNSSLDEFQFPDIESNNNIILISTCGSKLQQKPSSNLIEKSKVMISDYVQSPIDITKSLKIFSSDFGNENCNCEFSKEISILPPICINNVPVSSLKQSYDSHEVFKSFTRLFDSKLIVSNQYASEIMCESKFDKCVTKECLIHKPPLIRPNFSNHINTKISKLVAKFNRKFPETLSCKLSAFVKLNTERICLNLLNMRINQLVQEVVYEVIDDVKSGERNSRNLSSDGKEKKIAEFPDFENRIVPGIIPKNSMETSSMQILSSEISSFCDIRRPLTDKDCSVFTQSSCDPLKMASHYLNPLVVNESVRNRKLGLSICCKSCNSVFNQADETKFHTGLLTKNWSDSRLLTGKRFSSQEMLSCEPLEIGLCKLNKYHQSSLDINYCRGSLKESGSRNLSESSLINPQIDISIFNSDSLSYETPGLISDSFKNVANQEEKGRYEYENIEVDKKIVNIGEIEDKDNQDNGILAQFEVNSDRVTDCFVHDEKRSLSIIRRNSDVQMRFQNSDSSFDENSSNDSMETDSLNDRFENEKNLNNKFSNSEVSNYSKRANQKHESGSVLWLIVIIFFIVCISALFNSSFRGFFKNLTSSQSLYPKITSNGVPF